MRDLGLYQVGVAMFPFVSPSPLFSSSRCALFLIPRCRLSSRVLRLQLDVKLRGGVPLAVLSDALHLAKQGRTQVWQDSRVGMGIIDWLALIDMQLGRSANSATRKTKVHGTEKKREPQETQETKNEQHTREG